jgi:hypothetical protein
MVVRETARSASFANARAARGATIPRPIRCQRSGGVTFALLQVAQWRMDLFRRRFGRDPDPNEPLFFDPGNDNPMPVADAEMCRQVIAAARAAQVNVRLLLKHLGITEP